MRAHVENLLINYCIRFRPYGNYPAAIIACWYYGSFIIERSGAAPTPLSLELAQKLSQIGPIGSLQNGNIVGCCAEVRASNSVMMINNLRLDRLHFTEARRPRTMQVIPRCINCQNTFT